MLLMTTAVVICVTSAILWLMLPLTLIYLEGIVGPAEDRQLRRDFGDAYLSYKRRVHKWVPCKATNPSSPT